MFVHTPYFFFGLAFFDALGFAAVFGRGAFGSFFGTLATFFALDGVFFALAGTVLFFSTDFTTGFFGALAFFTLAALCFFTFGADAAVHELARWERQLFQSWQLPTGTTQRRPCLSSAQNCPEATAVFKYFLMNCDNFSESTL